LRGKLAAIAAAGFAGIEIFESDFLAFDGGPTEIGRMVRDHGLEIVLFQPFRDFEGMPEPQRAGAFDRAQRKFDQMGELGADLMLVCSNALPLALIDRAAADFHELDERAARHGVRIGYEALAWGRHVNDHRDAWQIVQYADHPNVGLILDSFHTLARGIDLETIRPVPGDRILFVALADAPNRYGSALLEPRRIEFDDGRQPVLREETLAHDLVTGLDARADDRPIAIHSGIEKPVQVVRLMRAMKIADSDVNDPGRQFLAPVCRLGHTPKRREVGEIELQRRHQLIQFPPSTL
jgi:sugar phosphate isomerase/epimerase